MGGEGEKGKGREEEKGKGEGGGKSEKRPLENRVFAFFSTALAANFFCFFFVLVWLFCLLL